MIGDPTVLALSIATEPITTVIIDSAGCTLGTELTDHTKGRIPKTALMALGVAETAITTDTEGIEVVAIIIDAAALTSELASIIF